MMDWYLKSHEHVLPVHGQLHCLRGLQTIAYHTPGIK
jgi:hypothetical protein